MNNVTYRVYFANAEHCYSWRTFKTFGGAYRFAHDKLSNPNFRQAHKVSEFAIVRAYLSKRDFGNFVIGDFPYGQIIAMSKGYAHGSGFVHRDKSTLPGIEWTGGA